MSAEILSFVTRKRPATGWKSEEIAECYRVIEMLGRVGLAVSIDMGLSDENDPWLVFVRDDTQDVIAHLAIIDGEYIAASVVSDTVFRSRVFRNILEQIVRAQPLVLPVTSGSNSRLLMNPFTVLAVFIATAFAYASNTEVYAGESPHDLADTPKAPDVKGGAVATTPNVLRAALAPPTDQVNQRSDNGDAIRNHIAATILATICVISADSPENEFNGVLNSLSPLGDLLTRGDGTSADTKAPVKPGGLIDNAQEGEANERLVVSTSDTHSHAVVTESLPATAPKSDARGHYALPALKELSASLTKATSSGSDASTIETDSSWIAKISQPNVVNSHALIETATAPIKSSQLWDFVYNYGINAASTPVSAAVVATSQGAETKKVVSLTQTPAPASLSGTDIVVATSTASLNTHQTFDASKSSTVISDTTSTSISSSKEIISFNWGDVYLQGAESLGLSTESATSSFSVKTSTSSESSASLSTTTSVTDGQTLSTQASTGTSSTTSTTSGSSTKAIKLADQTATSASSSTTTTTDSSSTETTTDKTTPEKTIESISAFANTSINNISINQVETGSIIATLKDNDCLIGVDRVLLFQSSSISAKIILLMPGVAMMSVDQVSWFSNITYIHETPLTVDMINGGSVTLIGIIEVGSFTSTASTTGLT